MYGTRTTGYQRVGVGRIFSVGIRSWKRGTDLNPGEVGIPARVVRNFFRSTCAHTASEEPQRRQHLPGYCQQHVSHSCKGTRVAAASREASTTTSTSSRNP